MEYGQTTRCRAPVLSLTILDQATTKQGLVCATTRVLVVVRDPKTNSAHPNVVSMPTQRIPPSLFRNILDTSGPIEMVDPAGQWHVVRRVNNEATGGHHPAMYAVEALLARKLGVSDQLEMDKLRFSVTLRLVTTGQSYHANLPVDRQVHHISMASMIVTISEGAELFPHTTSSYSHIFWVDTAKFLETVTSKNPMALESGLDPIGYCVHGLCVSTSYAVLARQLKASNEGAQNGERLKK
jgi:hypothetical protein